MTTLLIANSIRTRSRIIFAVGGTAALFVAMTLHFGMSAELPAYLYLAAVSVVLAMIDIDVRRLPNRIVLPSYLIGGALFTLAALVDDNWSSLIRGLLAMTALFVFYFVLAFISPGSMGFGDVKLAGLLGLYLGWLGWRSVLIGTLAGFLIGGLVGAILLITRRVDRKASIPFGPAMLTGALLTIFVANQLHLMLR